MEEKIRQGYLYDFYGELLNNHQKDIYESYIIEDMSLAEIANEQGISRQGVHDIIKRCNKTLLAYEDKLHLLDKFMKIRDDVKLIGELASTGDKECLGRIRDISLDIIDNL